MSQVRMCDNPGCGRIFSINAEGWQSGTLDVRHGRGVVENREYDICPPCTTRPMAAEPTIEPAGPAALAASETPE